MQKNKIMCILKSIIVLSLWASHLLSFSSPAHALFDNYEKEALWEIYSLYKVNRNNTEILGTSNTQEAQSHNTEKPRQTLTVTEYRNVIKNCPVTITPDLSMFMSKNSKQQTWIDSKEQEKTDSVSVTNNSIHYVDRFTVPQTTSTMKVTVTSFISVNTTSLITMYSTLTSIATATITTTTTHTENPITATTTSTEGNIQNETINLHPKISGQDHSIIFNGDSTHNSFYPSGFSDHNAKVSGSYGQNNNSNLYIHPSYSYATNRFSEILPSPTQVDAIPAAMSMIVNHIASEVLKQSSTSKEEYRKCKCRNNYPQEPKNILPHPTHKMIYTCRPSKSKRMSLPISSFKVVKQTRKPYDKVSTITVTIAGDTPTTITKYPKTTAFIHRTIYPHYNLSSIIKSAISDEFSSRFSNLNCTSKAVEHSQTPAQSNPIGKNKMNTMVKHARHDNLACVLEHDNRLLRQIECQYNDLKEGLALGKNRDNQYIRAILEEIKSHLHEKTTITSIITHTPTLVVSSTPKPTVSVDPNNCTIECPGGKKVSKINKQVIEYRLSAIILRILRSRYNYINYRSSESLSLYKMLLSLLELFVARYCDTMQFLDPSRLNFLLHTREGEQYVNQMVKQYLDHVNYELRGKSFYTLVDELELSPQEKAILSQLLKENSHMMC